MGNPFVHLDLAADDREAAKKFYGAVFDWKFQDVPDMNWTGVVVGKGVGGGIGGKNMPNQPSAWTAYVDVKDVKASIAKAEAHGAQIIVPHMAIGDMGFIGIFVDPQGATIGVWQQAKRPAAKRAAPKRAAAKKAAPKKAAKKAAPKKAAPKKAAPKKAAKKR